MRATTPAVVQHDEFSDLTEEYFLSLRAAGRSERSIEAYAYALTSLRQFAGPEVQPTDITPLIVSRWLGQRRTNVSPANASFMLRHSRPAFRVWHAAGLIDSDPFARVASPKVPVPVIPVLSDDEVRALWAVTDGSDWQSRRDRALIRCMLDTGLRRGEAQALTLGSVDVSAGLIHVRVSKSGRERWVPIGLKARRELRLWLRARQQYLQRHLLIDDGTLFISRHGRALHPQALYRAIHRRMSQAGISTPRAAHCLRHTFATRALEAGASELDVMHIAGWGAGSLSMLRRYTASTQASRAAESHRRWSLGDRL